MGLPFQLMVGAAPVGGDTAGLSRKQRDGAADDIA